MTSKPAPVRIAPRINGLPPQLRASLFASAAQHQAAQTHCGTCDAISTQDGCLPGLAARGTQNPTVAFFYEAIAPNRGQRAHPKELFATGKSHYGFNYGNLLFALGEPTEALRLQIPHGAFAAAEYAGQHLGVQNMVVLRGSNSEPASLLVRRFFGIDQTKYGFFVERSLEAARPFMDRVKAVAKENHIAEQHHLCALTSLALVLENVRTIQKFNALGPKVITRTILTTGLWLDADSGRLKLVDPRQSLRDNFRAAADITLPNASDSRAPRDVLLLGCCDMRAQVRHVLDGGHSSHALDGIAVLVANPEKVQQSGRTDDTLATIQYLYGMGRTKQIIVMGHESCGGQAGITQSRLGHAQLTPALANWLAQAEPDCAIEYIKRQGLVGPEGATIRGREIVAMSNKVRTAQHIAALTGRSAVLLYLQIGSRNINILPNRDDISAAEIADGIKPFLNSTVPKNVCCPPRECPPRIDGSQRMPTANRVALFEILAEARQRQMLSLAA